MGIECKYKYRHKCIAQSNIVVYGAYLSLRLLSSALPLPEASLECTVANHNLANTIIVIVTNTNTNTE